MVKYIVDYYAFLNVDDNADMKTIEKAYAKAMKAYKSCDSKTALVEKKYKYINDAYRVLSDDKKRAKYDELRDIALNKKEVQKTKKSGNINVGDAVDLVKDAEDNFGIISKLFKTGSGAMKAKGLMTGTNIIIGGAMAGYGIKKGRDYMAKRNGRLSNNK